MLDNLKLSFQSIFAHKMRSVLTMLGVIIGIASIIAIVAMIEGQKESLKSSLVGTGNNSIAIMFQSPEAAAMGGGDMAMMGGGEEDPPDVIPTITDEQLEEAKVPDLVKSIAVFYQNYTQAYHLNNLSDSELYAIDDKYFSIFPIKMLEGRKIAPVEHKNGSQVAMINEATRDALFPEGSAINQVIELNKVPFRVVGVYADEKSEEDNMFMMDAGMGKIYLPKSAWPHLGSFNDIPQVLVQAYHSDQLEEAGQVVADSLNSQLPATSTWQYSIPDLQQIMEDINEFNQAFTLLLGGIASISLLVGGIGVMNIMLVSVTERTREIGIKKALGAKRSVILWQFLTESAVLTSIGGIIGVLVGLGGAKAISYFAHLPFAAPVPAIIGSVVFSMAVGIIFGLIPSMKAAKMKPIDALRYE
ncbi:ABC transporter permease [Pseudobacillus badius]|uniref:ABC transporter permease n=1 Tax=Bacillus badius TaxID=1455 RepID=UPI0007B370E9|nr:ABC transporter permease [Bacillus badius]KZR59100.1 peptide ABC transporter permease [Bacillus badius]